MSKNIIVTCSSWNIRLSKIESCGGVYYIIWEADCQILAYVKVYSFSMFTLYYEDR